MPRASWNGFLRLCLVTCPVYLAPATTESKRIRFNQLNAETGNSIEATTYRRRNRGSRRA
jgi:DNA end-binding protein Ku